MANRIDRPKDLIDGLALRRDLSALHRRHAGNDSEIRSQVLALLKNTVNTGRDEAKRRFFEDGRGTRCARMLSFIQDELIRAIYDFTVTHVYRATNPSSAERIAIIAVGGYGRGTLAPGSDVDLLFLLPYKQTPWGESVVEYMLYLLWDLGFKVGHATRSVEQSIRLSKSDFTIRTAILEARFIWGDEALFADLDERFEKEILSLPVRDFIEAKLAERDIRHKAAGESRYLVEPNVKNGKGGLRDLHTLFWIGKYLHRARSVSDLVKAGLFTTAEYRKFRKCEDFLWAVRCHLHYLTGRAEEKLTFDFQAELASRLGYASRKGMRDVERFMRHYFLIAKDVGDLTRIFCAVLEAQAVKSAPRLGRVLNQLRRARTRRFPTSSDFVLEAGRITVADEDVFKRDPVNLIRLFHLAAIHRRPFHPHALQLATRSLKLINGKVLKDREANWLFLEILTSGKDPESVLRKMNEAGVLGRFVRSFGRIVAMMQFNMYHHYTVDEHLLRAIGILAEIERGELADAHPLSNEIIHKIKHRRALYLALFLHDIAKGRPESHSAAGARIARRLGPRLGLSAAETEVTAWLVENHLVMSDFAQKRDLHDFKTILDFAAIVQSPERLKLLLLLTVADIKAVGPGVWNGWKGELLRTLYYETEPVLAGGHTAVARDERIAAAKRRFAEHCEHADHSWCDAYVQRHYPSYWLNVVLERQLEHARLIHNTEAAGESFATAIKSDAFTEITELTVFVPDHPRLLAIIAGACALAGANIAGAQIYTTSDGMALDTVLIQRGFAEDRDESRRGERIIANIRDGLKGALKMPEALARRARQSDRMRAFTVEPQVLIDNDLSNQFSVIEVNGRDRLGLLYELTSALHRLNLNIGSAHVATFGERVVDVFYVTDLTGAKVLNASRRQRITHELLKVLEIPKPDRKQANKKASQSREAVA